jgi:hypothetical protein
MSAILSVMVRTVATSPSPIRAVRELVAVAERPRTSSKPGTAMAAE